MLIAEDLLLLLTDDDSGKLVASSGGVDVALGGALLIELTLLGRVDVAGPGESARKGRLVVKDAGPTQDPLLDQALAQLVGKQGKRPADVVSGLGKGVRRRLYARLTDRGLLRAESGKILGIFPSRQWPSEDAAHEESVRVLIAHALRVAATDDHRVAALISLRQALSAVQKVVGPDTVGLSKKEMKANAKRVAEGDWGSEAVRKAIDAMNAAVMVAMTAAVTAGASGS